MPIWPASIGWWRRDAWGHPDLGSSDTARPGARLTSMGPRIAVLVGASWLAFAGWFPTWADQAGSRHPNGPTGLDQPQDVTAGDAREDASGIDGTDGTSGKIPTDSIPPRNARGRSPIVGDVGVATGKLILRASPPSGWFYSKGKDLGRTRENDRIIVQDLRLMKNLFGSEEWINVRDEQGQEGWVFNGEKDSGERYVLVDTAPTASNSVSRNAK